MTPPPAAKPSPTAGSNAGPLAMSTRLWGLLFLLGLLWGGSFFLTQVVVHQIDTLALVALRVGIAALALLLFLPAAGLSMQPLRRRAGAFLVLGLLNNAVPFLLLAIGQKTIGAGLAAILNATTPLWTIFFAAILTSDERLTAPKLVGIFLGIMGVAVLVGPDAMGTAGTAPLAAYAAILGATLSYALAAIFAKRFQGVAPAVVATGQLCGSSLIMIPLALLAGSGSALGGLTASGAAAMLALALISTALAYILYFEVVAKAGATNASLVTFLVPASAILLGILFLGEAMTLREIAGFALILFGLAAIDGRLVRRLAMHPRGA